MLNIVIPMAGRGKRFLDAGYELPKPLIPVHNQPMIKLVIDNVRPRCEHRFVFLVLEEHIQRYGIADLLTRWAPGAAVLTVPGVTEGAACTVLTASHLIDNQDALLIANSDQWVDCRIDDFLAGMDASGSDGFIMTMKANDTKWSYAELDKQGLVRRVVEKVVVSDEATVGIYAYRHGSLFVRSARQMIEKNLRVNGEFYVAPAYDEMIATGSRVGIFNVGAVDAGMYGLGTPADLLRFRDHEISRRAEARLELGCKPG
jgi:NDP-sugar pyrophosphorylase family protein